MDTINAQYPQNTPVVDALHARGANGHTLSLVAELRALLSLCKEEGFEITPDRAAELLAADRRLRAAFESQDTYTRKPRRRN